jgi:polysaccharide deacetylase 2 family uncharacterized protein YibQ
VQESPAEEATPGGSRRFLWLALALGAAGVGALGALMVIGGDGGGRVELPMPPPAVVGAVPDAALVEQSSDGPLPVIAADGRQAWQVYARPFEASDRRPRVAVVISGLGLDGEMTRNAIDRLPPAVSLGFSPYARDLSRWIAATRKAGHEVLLGLPMEPADYPRQDPGPATLLTALDPAQNLARLRWAMSRGTNYVGLIAIMGGRFATIRQGLEPVLDDVKKRGLMFVDNRASDASVAGELGRGLGMAWAVADRRLDADTAGAIDQSLAELEGVAGKAGAALGLGGLHPATIEHVIAWAPTLDKKGLVLAPVTAIAGRQALSAKTAP